jgi:branched-chain amino acid:cation transporter, LIVCS family
VAEQDTVDGVSGSRLFLRRQHRREQVSAGNVSRQETGGTRHHGFSRRLVRDSAVQNHDERKGRTMNNNSSSGITPLALLAIGGSVFAMHFGASCMLWPVTWGQQSGNTVLLAYLGVFISGILFPAMGYLAVAREGSLFKLAYSVGPRFAQIFGGLTVLVLGPLFVIPRMSAASWDAICQLLGVEHSPFIPMVIFTIVYYLVAYWFLFKKEEIIDKISKYLLPVLILTVIAVVVKSMLQPLSSWVEPAFTESPFYYGFINGYQTMDLPAALMFAGIVIATLTQGKKVAAGKVSKYLAMAGIIGFIILGTSHFFQMIVGANTGDMFKDVSYARLYATVIINSWGQVGGTIFNIALIFAALTTAVGLGGGTASYFEEASQGKIGYRNCAIVTLAASCLVSMIGLTQIITLTAPILDIIYPPAIVLVLFILLAPNLRGARTGGTIGAFAWGLFDGLIGYANLMGGGVTLEHVKALFPLGGAGFGWITLAVIGALIGHFYYKKRNEAEPAN